VNLVVFGFGFDVYVGRFACISGFWCLR